MKSSKHLGALSFCEEGNESIVDGAAIVSGMPVAVRLVVQSPTSFDQAAIARMDERLDELTALDAAARERIATDISDENTTSGQFWAWLHADVPEWTEWSPKEFLSALKLAIVHAKPDGAWNTTSDLGLDYVIEEPENDQILVARFPDGHTPAISWES